MQNGLTVDRQPALVSPNRFREISQRPIIAQETDMKPILLAALALAACVTVDIGAAAARDYPYCLVGRDFAGFGDCQFDTLAQCQASASGRQATCSANPFPGYFDRYSGNAKIGGTRR